MPSPFPKPRSGEPVAKAPTGFPAFYRRRRPRIVTADVWALLRHLVVQRLKGQNETVALAYVRQALEFYEAAEGPIRSKPLLYYYSFLNLAKAALLFESVPLPPAVVHGISDPRANERKRIVLKGQRVRMEASGPKRNCIFPEFVEVLGGNSAKQRDVKIVDLLAQIPSIHRTFCHATGRGPLFAPLRSVEVLRGQGAIWARVSLNRDDQDVAKVLPVLRRQRAFSQALHQVAAGSGMDPDLAWFESKPESAKTNATDAAIARVARCLQDLGVWSILTASGYRHYLGAIRPSVRVPPLAAPYAVMFYLGSITRYKPHYFDSIAEGEFAWVIGELMATQPGQFIYGLASWMAGVDVVRPYASTK